MSKPFAQFIRDRRRHLGLTQRQVTTALGLKSVAFLSDIEAGNRKPSRELLPALARILKTDTETLSSHDSRSPLTEARNLLESHPEHAVALLRIIEHTRDLGPDEVLRRIEAPPVIVPKRKSSKAKTAAKSPDRPHRTKAPTTDLDILPL